MSAAQSHVIGRALIAERQRDRTMYRKMARIGEGDEQLIQRCAPLEAAVRHRPQVGDGQMASAVGRVRGRGDRRCIGRPHGRGRHRVGGECRLGLLDARTEPGEPTAMRPRVRQENALREPQCEIGAHLVDALERCAARLRNLAGVAHRRNIAEAQACVIVAGADDPVEIDFAQAHLATVTTLSPTSTSSSSAASRSMRTPFLPTRIW